MRRASWRLSIGLSLVVLLSLVFSVAPVLGLPFPELPDDCPAPDFDAEPTSGYAPLEVQFRDQTEWDECGGAPASFFDAGVLLETLGVGIFEGDCGWRKTWDFGDGSSAVADAPTHVYTKPGDYTVTLTMEWVCTTTFAFAPPVDLGRSIPGAFESKVSKTKKQYITVLARKEKDRDKPPEPANLMATNLYVNPTEVIPGQEVLIYADICNSGGEVGVKSATLYINGYAEQTQSVGAGPGQCGTVVFRVYKGPPGTYQVNVEGMQGQFTVVAPRIVMQNVPSQQPDTGIGTVGIIAIVVVGIVLIIALVLVLKKE